MQSPLDPRATFRGTCPVCDQSRRKPVFDGSGKETAITALRNHIMATDGEGHGPTNYYPPGFDPSTLSEHVIELDGNENPAEADD